ncbi:MAG TPA: hypothetical protein VKU41_19905 [Polyangiaceae bacterium]|nr:hypothetical protein [Polyangiaceae bacterium]
MEAIRALTLGLYAATLACDLALGGEEFVAGGAPEGASMSLGDAQVIAFDASASIGLNGDAGGASSPSPSQGETDVPDAIVRDARDEGARDPDADVHVRPDAPGDAQSEADTASASAEAGAPDAVVADAPVTGAEAGGPCTRLAQCCQTLALAPPLAFACYAAMAGADGGDGGSTGGCETALMTFADAGLCM